jgi:small subunit ribosomal protein S17
MNEKKMENKQLKKITSGRKKGTVISDLMEKTVVVEVSRFESHPKYGKKVRVSKKYKAHCEGGKCKKGDMVEIEPCRPMSKGKKYRVITN